MRWPTSMLAPGSSRANSSPPMRASVSLPRSPCAHAGKGFQHLVAGGMAIAIVDALEVIEIEQRHAAALPPCGCLRPAHQGTGGGWAGLSARR
jgi:hypothetical protein